MFFYAKNLESIQRRRKNILLYCGSGLLINFQSIIFIIEIYFPEILKRNIARRCNKFLGLSSSVRDSSSYKVRGTFVGNLCAEQIEQCRREKGLKIQQRKGLKMQQRSKLSVVRICNLFRCNSISKQLPPSVSQSVHYGLSNAVGDSFKCDAIASPSFASFTLQIPAFLKVVIVIFPF